MNNVERVKKYSIIQNAPYRCMQCGSYNVLHLHHCLHGNADKPKADKDGLFILLCIYCHKELHDKDASIDRKYKKLAQKAYMKTHTLEEFMKRYNQNYLWDKE